MNVTVYLGANVGNDPAIVELTKKLGKRIGENGHRLIYGGSEVGLMGILAKAVLEVGGEVVGVEPEMFIESEKQYDAITELIVTKDFAERRNIMIEKGDMFIALPGGAGTLDEITEVISAARLNLIKAPVYLINYDGYYDPLIHMYEKMIEKGYYEEESFENIHFTDVDGIQM